MNPRFGRRTWVKLWVNEWLDGTTRFEISDAQRAFWTDLLAMAGRSRFPGVICAGKINDEFVGYPINKFQALMSEPLDVESTFELFKRTGKVTFRITSESPTKLYMLELTNWDKYQSEYQRQKKYRRPKLQRSAEQGDTSSNKTEVEVEREREKGKPPVLVSDQSPTEAARAFLFHEEVCIPCSDFELRDTRAAIEAVCIQEKIEPKQAVAWLVERYIKAKNAGDKVGPGWARGMKYNKQAVKKQVKMVNVLDLKRAQKAESEE